MSNIYEKLQEKKKELLIKATNKLLFRYCWLQFKWKVGDTDTSEFWII